jgi:hypothetical protein
MSKITAAKARQLITLLEQEGSAQVILDAIQIYGKDCIENNKSQIETAYYIAAKDVIKMLKKKYTSYLPKKKAPKSKQIDLEASIADVKGEKTLQEWLNSINERFNDIANGRD